MTGRFQNESFQAVDCAGNDNRTQPTENITNTNTQKKLTVTHTGHSYACHVQTL